MQKRTGIAVLSQRFIFNGACLAPDTTVGGAGLVADSICFVLPKTEAFPERLGPFNMFSTALDKDSFEIPTWDATVGFEGGMFMVTAAAAGQHGVTAVESAANIFPLVGQACSRLLRSTITSPTAVGHTGGVRGGAACDGCMWRAHDCWCGGAVAQR